MSSQTLIQVGFNESTVWVRVSGRGSFQNSSPLKDFAKEMLSRGYKTFVIDLGECPVMDSTFMGTLAGIALKLQASEGTVRVTRLNERNFGLLSNLGLDQLLKLEAQTGAESAPGATQEFTEVQNLATGPQDKQSQAVTMLEAHEAVVEANPENEAKFKDVLEFLRQNVEEGE